MTRFLYLAFAALAVLTATTDYPAWAGDSDSYYGHMMWGGGWFLGPMTMIIILVVVVLVVVMAVRWTDRGAEVDRSNQSVRTAVQILEERFARGEIDRAEFEDRKRTLGG